MPDQGTRSLTYDEKVEMLRLADDIAGGEVADFNTAQAQIMTRALRIAGDLDPPPFTALIPAGVYYGVDGANFYSVERNAGCGQRFHNQWRHRAAEFPQTREAALALMPEWLAMLDAPRNATEIILRIPQKGHPGFYEQIGHWAEMDGSEQPPCKGWFRNTGCGFVELPEPTGWRWLMMIAPANSATGEPKR